MLNPDPNAIPNPEPNPEPNPDTTPDPAAAISVDEMLAGIGQQMGGSPLENEEFSDASAVEKAILEEQYAQRVERAFEKMQKEVKAKIEDATEGQIHEIGMAFMQGDISKGIDAIQQALRQADEVDNNMQEQKNLHVEGNSGGDRSDDGKNEGLSGVLSNIANTYSNRSV